MVSLKRLGSLLAVQKPSHAWLLLAAVSYTLAVAGAAIWLSSKPATAALVPSYLVPSYTQDEALPGGATSVAFTPFARFDLPVANLARAAKPHFHAAKALANQPWIKAPATTDARDGLGPIYNARSCLACHVNGGKGTVPDDDQTPLFSTLVRLSIPDPTINDSLATLPEPSYGWQLQTQSTALSHQLRNSSFAEAPKNEVAPEGYAYVTWQSQPFTYPSGEVVSLRAPSLELRQLGYGPLHPATQFSLRLAPAILGMGLIELIPQNHIDALADAEDTNGDGISGRVNKVWDETRQVFAAGRFGLKANRAFLDTTVAAAFGNDLGISSPLFNRQPCSPAQSRCLAEPTGNNAEGFELPAELLQSVVDFNRYLAVPKRRNPEAAKVQQGRDLFYQSACASCHQPRFVTAQSADFPALSEQVIWPYSDFLLHDMGEALSDHRPDGNATGQEWRTPPLWGLGLNVAVNGSRNLLHDGRARSVEEAILWHSGEAEASKQRFMQMEPTERAALIAFVESL